MTKELLGKIKEIEEKMGQGWIKEFEEIKTVDALKQKAAELDIEMSDEMIEEAFKLLNSDSEELSEDELATISGGKCWA